MADFMTETITVFAPKGGVGRTTTTASLALGLIDLGKRVVVVDAAHSFQRNAWREIAGFTDDDPSPLVDWANKTKSALRDPDVLSARIVENAPEVADILEDVDDDRCWDYAIVDTPAVPDLTSMFSIVAANLVLCPAQTSSDAFDLSSRLAALAMRQKRSFYSLAVGTNDPASIWSETIELPMMRCAIPSIGRFSISTPTHENSGLLGPYLPHASGLAREVMETLDRLSHGRWSATRT